MKRWWLGVLVGMMAGSAAYATGRQPLEELRVQATTAQEEFAVPGSYGRLAAVAIRAEIQYLYFEDAAGTIRIVALGPKGSVQRARSGLQLLTPDIFVVPRSTAS